MAHFAQISEDNTVLQVIVLDNAHIGEPTLEFPDTEAAGRAFIANTLRLPGWWKQTSYNGSFRKRYAGIGFTYDSQRDEFVPPGWQLVNGEWTAPEVDEPEEAE